MVSLTTVIIIILVLLFLYRTLPPRTTKLFLQPPGQVELSIFSTHPDRVKVVTPVQQSNQDPAKTSQPLDYVGGAPIDLNGNDQTFLFVGTGRGEDDLLLYYDPKQNKMVDIIDQTNLSSKSATYSAVSADIDHNGLTDLVVAREDGVHLYLNHGRGRFERRKLSNASRNSVPVSLAITDYNKDGHADIYVSQYLHPRLQSKEQLSKSRPVQNLLLEGIGRGVFEDVAVRTRTNSPAKQGTRSAGWIDLDQDKLPDLVLVQDDGYLEILQNTRGASGAKYTSGPLFRRKKLKIPTGFGYQMALGSGDYDNDGDVDLYLNSLKKGNKLSQNQIILRNDGDFNFKQIDPKTQEHDLSTGWGAIMEDLNFDGHQDLLNASLTEDTNRDGKPDFFWLNTQGPHRIYLNHLAKKNQNWVGVKLPDDTQFMNATVKVVSINDQTGKTRTQTKQKTTGVGAGSDSSKILKFGLDQDNRILYLAVETIYDGNLWIHPRPKINMIATFRDMRSNNYTAK